MLPLTTARLTVRMFRTADVATFHAYRNDPDIARHQLWDLPFPLDRAAATADTQADHHDVIIGDWTTMAIELDGTTIGDVVTKIDDTGSIAEIGYTLARPFHGRGYASEAAAAVAAALFDEVGITRLVGELDPANVASARVLEAIGLRFESLAKRSFLWRGEWTDNLVYSATAEEFEAWRRRPAAAPDAVELVEITPETQRSYAALETHWSQRRFVAPVATSFGDALFPELHNGAPVVPWIRGVLADGEPAGFVMIAAATGAHPHPFLWRLLVDRRHQRRGIGQRVIRQLVGELRAAGHSRFELSYVGGVPGSPEPFYTALGFVPTGEMDGAETIAALTL